MQSEPTASPDGRIKVLHLITGLGLGGAETMLYKVLANMDQRRFSARVVSLLKGDAPLASKIIELGIPVDSLNLGLNALNPRGAAAFLQMLRAWRPDILQAWMYHANLFGLIAARATRVPKVVWNIRCSDVEFRGTSRLRRFAFRAHAQLARFSDVTIVNSIAGMQFHQASGHRPPRWELIQNGFDLAQFRPDPERRARARAELGLDDTDVAIGMLARFHPFKDHRSFIAAAGLLHARHQRAVFVLAGGGLTSENREIIKLLHEAKVLDCTRLLGEYKSPAALLPGLDIATLCSLTEGFPNALGEAMCCEVPCAASDVGDSAFLLGETGRTFPPGDPHAVAAAWDELIALGPVGRQQLGCAARARIREHFSMEGIVSAYQELYAELASQTRGSASS